MAAYARRSHAMFGVAGAAPGQYARYCIENSALRWTNAVRFFGTRLMAPPQESRRTMPEPVPEERRASSWRMSSSIPDEVNGWLQMLDLAANVARPPSPPAQ